VGDRVQRSPGAALITRSSPRRCADARPTDSRTSRWQRVSGAPLFENFPDKMLGKASDPIFPRAPRLTRGTVVGRWGLSLSPGSILLLGVVPGRGTAALQARRHAARLFGSPWAITAPGGASARKARPAPSGCFREIHLFASFDICRQPTTAGPRQPGRPALHPAIRVQIAPLLLVGRVHGVKAASPRVDLDAGPPGLHFRPPGRATVMLGSAVDAQK
jgi:hypothetical protein